MSSENWQYDPHFMKAARLAWPETTSQATSYRGTKGRAAARRLMAARYEGYRMIKTLAALGSAVSDAIAELRGSP